MLGETFNSNSSCWRGSAPSLPFCTSALLPSDPLAPPVSPELTRHREDHGQRNENRDGDARHNDIHHVRHAPALDVGELLVVVLIGLGKVLQAREQSRGGAQVSSSFSRGGQCIM